MDRPQVITRQALEAPPAEQTTNIQRGQPSPTMGSGPASLSSPLAPRPAGTTTGTMPPTAMSPAEG
jgi:hypothetical protein